jgi:hypothetical protein
MKRLLAILLLTWVTNLNAQTYWSSREYRIPGLGSKSTDVGVRYSNGGFEQDIDTLLLSFGHGRELNKNMEGSVMGAIGYTDIPSADSYLNVEIGGDLTPKYEFVLGSGAKIVPFARVGITGNLFSNYRETTVGRDYFYRYYYATGDMYFDFYGNYAAGLSYIGVDNKWAVSSEIGKYRSLGGDLDYDYETSIWTSQMYFKVGATSEIKLMYSVEAESEMKTIGLFWSRSW